MQMQERAAHRDDMWARMTKEAQRRLPWIDLKNLLLVMLGLWIAYFAAVHMFVRTLNKIELPVLEMPLGLFLAVQGAMIVFFTALYVFTKRLRAQRA
jgi:putative solute:sodium symporter small subunit